MEKIKVLDCTLRDGGYCNEWKFGNDNIKKIISYLVKANIDIIECGFFTNKIQYNPDITKFTDLQQVENLLPDDKGNSTFVVMANYDEIDVETLPTCKSGKPYIGIRLAFHKKDVNGALTLCEKIIEKGYKVFVQAMVSLNYSDEEFIKLIQKANEIEPYAFYIVDSFGVMKRKDLIRLFYMIENSLKNHILIGYHSHNNLQLAYSNAQSLSEVHTKRGLIFDSSIFGMGRGAGNLNTELFVEYLNDYFSGNYRLQPLLNSIDEIINRFWQENYWGYSLPNHLSAKHNIHPNYAVYLDNKKTLTVKNIDEIFSMMDSKYTINFNKEYIEELYLQYMNRGIHHNRNLEELKSILENRTVFLIAPGKSIEKEKQEIYKLVKDDDIISVSINFKCSYCDTDYIFVSNVRRFKEIKKMKKEKIIATSNIATDEAFVETDYSRLINHIEAVEDNAGMMAIQFFIDLGIKKIVIAGMDGYYHNPLENFAEDRMAFYSKNSTFDEMNKGMEIMLQNFQKQIEIEFLTKPLFMK